MRKTFRILCLTSIIYCLISLISGCSTKKETVYVTEYVEVRESIPPLSRPVSPLVRPINFKVTNNNISLSHKDYDNLNFNLLEILRYKMDTDIVLDYYEYKLKGIQDDVLVEWLVTKNTQGINRGCFFIYMVFNSQLNV